MASRPLRHMWIPDTQIKPDVPTDHIAAAARYAADKRPDVIVIGGDWFDMPSLSSYDRGRLASEGRRYAEDIQAGNDALDLFARTLKKQAPTYNPRKLVVLGNHEERIVRAIDEDARLEGKLSMEDLDFKKHGWVVHPFLKPARVDGVTYVHYCPLNDNGQVTNGKNGAPTAMSQARRMMTSTVTGHRQGLDIAFKYTPGRTVVSVIAGSFYQHHEKYLSPMGEQYWRGLVVLNDVRNGGMFEPMPVSLDYLKRRYT